MKMQFKRQLIKVPTLETLLFIIQATAITLLIVFL